MKVSRAQAAANRERVVAESARLFRDRGFAAVGLNELMQSAGLTRGGFYGQFESKQDLVRLALSEAMAQNLANWEKLAGAGEEASLRRYIENYLSDRHQSARAAGCTMAALAGDIGREDAATRALFERGLCNLEARVQTLMPGATDAQRRQRTWACLSALVGALTLSRSVTDPALAAEIRQATIDTLVDSFVPATR
ncbi:TetR family transcriptional regulator [Bordetella genomosp. 1]|uniref:TetR family transcriptional regulator n=1 Tax=Bordetella genomosp. 1 TaxID=1395607 RepID=A0A261SF17_9BORD|nr:TetR/AcrR family transcriptional regulator [Bordetella genomosp. 1]OZI35984.1 TetR family transcriptional regulator [Bordetella genomosp. 1]